MSSFKNLLNTNNIIKATAGLLAITGTYSTLKKCFYTVDGGHRAVMFNRINGVKEQVYGEGLHFCIPYLEWPTIFDCRTKPRKIASPTGTKDLQMVNIQLRVLIRPRIAQLTKLYRELGKDYDEKVLPSIANETLKSVVAQFNAAELITQREQVSTMIRRQLTERALKFYIDVEDVSITDLTFGNEYAAAVEAKQVAAQDAERAKFIVEKAAQDAKSIVIKAQGEATSAALIGKALSANPGFVELRKLETAKKVSAILADSKNKVYLDAESLMTSINDKY